MTAMQHRGTLHSPVGAAGTELWAGASGGWFAIALSRVIDGQRLKDGLGGPTQT